MRNPNAIIKAQKVNMGGIFIDQPLPVNQLEYADPFLLIHHWKSHFQGNQHPRDVGVGPHPHRGFSPVTVVFKGSLHHRDSLGGDSIVNAGGVQWMNAGKGITHSERPSAEMAQNGGEFEIIQFWVNTPHKYKLDLAEYIPLNKEDIPVWTDDSDTVALQVIAGEIKGLTGPVSRPNALAIARLDMDEGSSFNLDLPDNFNVLVYQLEGHIKCGEFSHVHDKTMLFFEPGDGTIEIKAEKSSKILILAGEPIDEKVQQYGPFVMSNMTEIMEAMRDAQQGKMGILIEEF